VSELSEQAKELIYDMCALRDLALMNGATRDSANELTFPLAKELGILLAREGGSRPYERRQSPKPREYRPRRDWSLATPRLPDREWWPLRWSIIQRDGEVCRYCGDDIGPFCVDHVVPLSRGGANHPNNLVVACIPCNSSKNDRLLSEWRGRYQ
jgi:hypothetical protein